MQDDTFAGVKANVNAPFLPFDMVATSEREARALGLRDVDGPLGLAQRTRQLRIRVVAMFGRYGHDAEVQHRVHALVGDVDVGNKSIHRVSPGAVFREVLDERQPA